MFLFTKRLLLNQLSVEPDNIYFIKKVKFFFELVKRIVYLKIYI
jgi:hypothetical protein